MPQPLNSKDQANFRQLVKFYEAKQYKKALKTADALLKKNPNHGDTEAMKALVINSLGNPDEAFDLAKLALRHDIKSYICWHVYGLLYRSVKNYEESIKAYKTALKLEPDSVQILRDLAFLQAQMRDYHGYTQSRQLMLQAKPVLRQNWTALAVAQHLAGELTSAENTLKTYEGTLKQTPPRTDQEHSEAQLYRNMIIEESGEFEKALEHLESIATASLDRVAVMEAKARLLLKLDKLEEAETAYRDLIDRNNDYRFYYESLEKCLGLDRSKKEDLPKLVDLYESYAEKNERVDAPRRIPLDFLKGAEFKSAADIYLHRMLKKGVFSTFTNVKGLYENQSKHQTILQLVEDYLSDPHKEKTNDSEANGNKPSRIRESSLYFLAQHYDYHVTRDLTKAMKYIDEALETDPKSVVYNQTKGRIYKHLGNTAKAAEILEKARKLDEKDRYINTKCAKYQLRNNQNDLALETMSKFTRNEAVGGPLADLLDMQCMWFLTEDGDAYLRRGKLSLALKRYKQIYEIFETWEEDQFDFHQFSMRKGPIRAYIDMVRWEDKLREHPFFSRAAISAVKMYVMLHDNPDLSKGFDESRLPGWSKMNANDRKKALKKFKKAQDEEQRKIAEKASPPKKKEEGKKEDTDPNGVKMLETKTPLDDALPYVNFLVDYSPKNIIAQLVSFDIYLRRQKYLLALKCLKAANSIDSTDPGLHERKIQLSKALDSADISDPKVSSVLKSCGDFIPSASSLEGFNNTYYNTHKSSPQHLLGALGARQTLDSSSKSQSEKDIRAILEIKQANLEDVQDAVDLLREWKSDEGVINDFREAAKKTWPDATIFQETKA